MLERINRLLDRVSEFLAHRKGLLPIVGLFFVLLNLAVQFIPHLGWLKESNLLLHVGVIVAILGFLLAWAL